MLEDFLFKTTKTGYVYRPDAVDDPYQEEIIIPVHSALFKAASYELLGEQSRIQGILTPFFAAGYNNVERTRYIEKNIYSLFHSVNIYVNRTHLEENEHFHRYYHMINDITQGPHDRYEESIFLAGKEIELYNELPTVTVTSTDPPGTDTYTAVVSQAENAIDNVVFNNCFSLGLDLTNHGQNVYFSIPMKGILNENIPISLLEKGFEIRIRVEKLANVFVTSNEANEQISFFVLHEMAYNALVQKLNVPRPLTYEITTTNYKCERFYVPAGSNSVHFQSNLFHFRNVHNFLFYFSNVASNNLITHFNLSQRSKANVSEFYVQFTDGPLNGKRFPRNPIMNNARNFMELRRCFPKTKGIMTASTFNNNLYTTATDDAELVNGPPNLSQQKRFVGAICTNNLDLRETNVEFLMQFENVADTFYPVVKTPHYLTEDLHLYVFAEYTVRYIFHNNGMVEIEK